MAFPVCQTEVRAFQPQLTWVDFNQSGAKSNFFPKYFRFYRKTRNIYYRGGGKHGSAVSFVEAAAPGDGFRETPCPNGVCVVGARRFLASVSVRACAEGESCG